MNIMPCILWAPAFEVQFISNLHYDKPQSKVQVLIDQTALIYVAPVMLTWPSRVTRKQVVYTHSKVNSSAPALVLLVKLEEKEEREKEDFYLSTKETLTIQPLGKPLFCLFFAFL